MRRRLPHLLRTPACRLELHRDEQGRPAIAAVSGAARRSALRAGDRIISVGGQPTARHEEALAAIRASGDDLLLLVLRDPEAWESQRTITFCRLEINMCSFLEFPGQESKRAAVCIQRHWRGVATRKRYRRMLTMLRHEYETEVAKERYERMKRGEKARAARKKRARKAARSAAVAARSAAHCSSPAGVRRASCGRRCALSSETLWKPCACRTKWTSFWFGPRTLAAGPTAATADTVAPDQPLGWRDEGCRSSSRDRGFETGRGFAVI